MQKNKKIGIDIDGVLTREGDEKNNIWQKALRDYLGHNIERKRDVFNFIEAYDLPEETINDFLQENIEDIYRNVKPAPKARKVLQELKNKKYTLTLITARDLKFHELTLNWLNRYKIPYDFLYHEKIKAPLACEKKIEMFIEDNKNNALQLLENGIAVIIKDRYHNRSLNINNHKNLYRASDWSEIKKIIYNYFNHYPENCSDQ